MACEAHSHRCVGSFVPIFSMVVQRLSMYFLKLSETLLETDIWVLSSQLNSVDVFLWFGFILENCHHFTEFYWELMWSLIISSSPSLEKHVFESLDMGGYGLTHWGLLGRRLSLFCNVRPEAGLFQGAVVLHLAGDSTHPCIRVWGGWWLFL